MLENIYWDWFEQSGDVNAYLAYKNKDYSFENMIKGSNIVQENGSYNEDIKESI